MCEHPLAAATDFGLHSFGCSSVAKLVSGLPVSDGLLVVDDDRADFRSYELMSLCRPVSVYLSWAGCYPSSIDFPCILTESRKMHGHVDRVAPHPVMRASFSAVL